MKLYNSQMAPNPRRVRVFIAEKGLQIATQEVDLFGGENLADAYRAKNPMRLVPALELDDGTVLFETPAICRYLESQWPEPNLMGRDPIEAARIEGWERLAEINGMQAVGEYYRNATPALDDRAVPGLTGIDRLPALVERGEKRIAAFFEQLESRLSASKFLAGDGFGHLGTMLAGS
jgi:glutathione S-transferase